MRNFAKAHWRGEQPIATSILAAELVPSVFLLGGFILFIDLYFFTLGPLGVCLLGLILFALGAGWSFWFVVGMYRSRNVVAFLIATLIGFLSLKIVILGTGFLRDLSFEGPNEPEPSLSFEEASNTPIIIGPITFHTFERFREMVDQNGHIDLIELDSGGGDLRAAIRISKTVEARSLDTFVSGDCASACTTAFMGGKKRIIVEAATLGFHIGEVDGIPEWVLKLGAKLMWRHPDDVFLKHGVSKPFLEKVYATPTEDIWEPSICELVAENIVTHVMMGEHIVSGHAYCE